MAAAAQEAEEGYKNFRNLSAEWAWKFTILRATVLRWRGMNEEVLKLMDSQPEPPQSGDLAVQIQRLEGVAYGSLLNFPEAERKLAKAERLCAVADSPACEEVIRARAVLAMGKGGYADAEKLFRRVLAAARSRGNEFQEANTLVDLSWCADRRTHFDEALDWANDARRISTKRGFADVAQIALGNMGWAYYKLGDPEKAEGMFIEAGDQAGKLNDFTSQSGWLATSGYVYLDAGELDAAKQSFQHSFDLAQETKNPEDIIDALSALAFLSEQASKLDDAKRYADEALARARGDKDNNAKEDANRDDVVYPLLVQGRLAARLHDAVNAEFKFREVEHAKGTPVFLKWEAERALARLYENENKVESANREYQTALSTFEGARSELEREDSRVRFVANASRIYDDYIHFLIAQGKINQALQVAEYSRGRTLTEGLGFLQRGSSFKLDPVNAQEIASRAGGTLLFYWLGEGQSYLWAITPLKIALFTLPPATEIKARVERYRKAIIDQHESQATANDDGVALYRILVEPAKDLLPKNPPPKESKQKDSAQKDATKARKVFIIPDGSLNSLNFETLLVPEPRPETQPGSQPEAQPHYWIEDVTLSSASSLRMLQAFHASHSQGAGNLLLFGDAVSPSEDFPHLPEAAIEMRSIEKHFPPAQEQVFSGDQANPPAYLASKPERFSYVHFVAHGTASRLSPLDSAIVLSKAGATQAGAEEDSFKLYARDIIQHPLHAELVTISTCRSAGARAYSGEGLVGLSWAFVRAGAHNVIGALWDVSDASTPQLMDELYAELKKGETPDAALRHAKLTLLRSSASFRKPFYWAPFQIYTGS